MSEKEEFFNMLLLNTGRILLAINLLLLAIGVLKWTTLNTALKTFWSYLLAVVLYNFIEQGFIWSVTHYTNFWRPFLKEFQIGDTNFLNILSREIDYIILGIYYSKVLHGVYSKLILAISIALFGTALCVYFWVDGFRTFGNVNATINRLFLVIIPTFHLWFLNKSAPVLNLSKNSYFLISVGLLIPNLFGLFLSFVGDKINQTDFILFVQLSLVRNALSAIGLLLFAYAFYQSKYIKYLPKFV